MGKTLVIYLLLANIVTFLVYGDDKRRARKGKWRTSEMTLVVLALAGGALGALLGMIAFRHKTRHTSFVIGIPAILAVWLLLVFMLAD